MKKRIAELQKLNCVVTAKKWWNGLSRSEKVLVITIVCGVTVAVATYIMTIGAPSAVTGMSITAGEALWTAVIFGGISSTATYICVDSFVDVDSLSFNLSDL